MKFETFLALRYFKGTRKGARFLSFIKIMSVAGVAVGSAGLLIALSIVHGFKSTINNKVLGFAPHYTVTQYLEARVERADTLLSYLDQFPEIEQKQAVIEGQVMIQTNEDVTGCILKGVEAEGGVSDLANYVNSGTWDLTKQSNDMPGLVLGSRLAEQIQAQVGDVITIYTVDGIPSLMNSPEIKQFVLTGIYKTGIDQFDDVFAIVENRHARTLFKLSPQEASAIEIRLANASQVKQFEPILDKAIPFPYFNDSIYDKFGNIFAWVELQENMIPLVISVMIIVAAFNLIGAVLMMILERTRDIGILKTIGTRSSIIRKVFLMEGLLVAGVGLLIGMGVSLIFVWLQMQFQFIPLSQENYYMSYAPVEPHLLDFLAVTVVTVVLCGLASWIPARVAARTDPLKVIAYGR